MTRLGRLASDLWASMASAGGTALATWLSAVLSFGAIAIALRVFIVEQRRYNDERLAASRREIRLTNGFLDAAVETVLQLSNETISAARKLLEPGAPGAGSDVMIAFLKEVTTLIDALWILRHQAPPDPDIMRPLARAQRLGEAIKLQCESYSSVGPQGTAEAIELSATEASSVAISIRQQKIEPSNAFSQPGQRRGQ